MPLRVLSTQPTPNPNALKFLLDREVASGTLSFLSAEQAVDHPLAMRLFEVTGVTSVMLLGDFLTVNKSAAVAWSEITPRVRKILEASAS